MEAYKLQEPSLTVVRGVNILGLMGQIGTHRASKERWKEKANGLLKEKHRLRNELKKVAAQLVEARLRIQRLELTHKVKAEAVEEPITRRIAADDIISIVCAYKGVSVEAVKGKCRSAEMAYPRQLCYYLCAHYSPLGLKRIGQLFSRDHSTVISGREKISTFRDLYEDVRTDVEYLVALIQNI